MKQLFIVLISLLVLTACTDKPEDTFKQITINGNVTLANGSPAEGTIYFRAFYLWSLDGEFRHTLAEIVDFESNTPNYQQKIDYNLTTGEGIAVLAWLDTDGDKIFCTPTYREDPAGLAWKEGDPAEEVELNIVLTDNCQAETFFYPPK